jgi:hypothetical protein
MKDSRLGKENSSKHLGPGVTRIGYLYRSDESDEGVASVEFDEQGAVIRRPHKRGFGETLTTGRSGYKLPEVLHFLDTIGRLTFTDCLPDSYSTATSGIGMDVIRSSRTIHPENDTLNFTDVDGMRSEVEGLADWTALSPVEQFAEFDSDQPRMSPTITIRARNKEPLLLGGRLNLRLATTFRHNPQPVEGTYSITDNLFLETTTDALGPWSKHATVHRAVQDLMCLVYGKPCGIRLLTVKRGDDQPELRPDETRRVWREVYEPTFGRSAKYVPNLSRKDRPLFRHSDIDSDALENLLDDFEHWSRPIWIAANSLFQRPITVELSLLQMGFALEALGYAIVREGGAGNLTKTPNFQALLKAVVEEVELDHPKLYSTLGPKKWRTAFDASFKARHADQPLPSGDDAWDRATEGMTLIRCWLARKLGVDKEVIVGVLDRG